MKRSNPKNIYIHIKGKKSWNLVFLGEFLISIVFVGGFEEFVNCSISISAVSGGARKLRFGNWVRE